jgi:hypothetical protein
LNQENCSVSISSGSPLSLVMQKHGFWLWKKKNERKIDREKV